MSTSTQGISIFATMSQMCKKFGAINLAQGCPDFQMDKELVTLAHTYMQQGYNQYAPMEGILELRKIIAIKTKQLYNAEYNPATEITITTGATEAVYCAIAAVVTGGDEVIIFEPSFDSYTPIVKMFGGKPVPVRLHYPNYQIDWNLVEKSISASTRLIIINSPHNPTGRVLSAQDMEVLAYLAAKNNFYILSDEVYEHITFDGVAHQSASSYHALKEKTFVTYSFGKTFHSTGWRLGACLAPAALTALFRKVHQFVTFSPATPFQYAIAEYMKNEKNYLGLSSFYQHKRDIFINLMRSSRFTYIPSEGTYFQLMCYDKITNKTDTEFCHWLVSELKVACIPLSPFYTSPNNENIVRFCFAKKEETLIQAAELLCKI